MRPPSMAFFLELYREILTEQFVRFVLTSACLYEVFEHAQWEKLGITK